MGPPPDTLPDMPDMRHGLLITMAYLRVFPHYFVRHRRVQER